MNKSKLIEIISIALMALGTAAIFLWALGKSVGIIHSPAWVELIPFFGGAVTLGGVSVGAGKVFQKLDRVITDVEILTRTTGRLDSRLIKVETKLDHVEGRLDRMGTKITHMDNRLNKAEHRIEHF